MLIRSQDKKQLINLDNVTRLSAGKVYGKNETDWLIEADSQPFRGSIGQYSSEEKVIKILSMIEDKYRICPYAENNGIQYSAPFPKVFQMPSDEEAAEPTVQDVINDIMTL